MFCRCVPFVKGTTLPIGLFGTLQLEQHCTFVLVYVPLTAQCHEHVRLTVNVTITAVLHRKMHFKKRQQYSCNDSLCYGAYFLLTRQDGSHQLCTV